MAKIYKKKSACIRICSSWHLFLMFCPWFSLVRTKITTRWAICIFTGESLHKQLWHEWVGFVTEILSPLHLWIDQCHRYGRHQGACREPAGSYDETTRTAICFEHKTQYLLIRVPYIPIVIFWHISNIPPMISQSQISCNTPTFYIAALFVKYCYKTGSWLL